MKAMVFAAGFGTRLGALTANTPKCLIKAGGHSMLEHVVERLKKAGVTSLIINLHYLPDQIVSFVQKKNNFGIQIEFSRESEILGTGGGLKKARYFFNSEEPFIVYNSDIYCDLDLQELLQAQQRSGAIATLAVMDRKESSYLLFDKEQKLVGWEKSGGKAELVQQQEQQGAKRAAFCGIQVLSPEIFDYMKFEKVSFSIIDTYMAAAKCAKKVMAHEIDGHFWADMGSPNELDKLNAYLLGMSALNK